MRKKGFTLVELLAVIAILAILVIIALPNVMGMFNEAKKNSFMTEVKQIYKIAQQEWVSDSMFNTSEKEYGRCDGCTYKELSLSGRREIKYYIRLDKAGNVVKYKVTDGTYQYEYKGPSLLVENIVEPEVVADLEDNKIITITNDEQDHSITVLYKAATRISDQCIITTHTQVCDENATIWDCLGSLITSNQTHNIYFKQNDSTLIHVEVQEKVLPSTIGTYQKGNLTCPCLDADSELDVYDKKKKKRLKKKIKDITYNDLILVWNFDEGKLDYALPLWIMKPVINNKVMLLTFDDGTKLKVVGNHRIFNIEANMFTRIMDNETEIGIHTYNLNGNQIRLIKKEILNEEAYAYNVITNKHINVFANGILTSQGSNNIYDIKDMKFVKEEREQFTNEDLENIDSTLIDGLRLNEWNIYDKGSKEETLKDLKDYVNRLNINKQ